MYRKRKTGGGKRTEECILPKKNHTTLLKSSKELSRTKLKGTHEDTEGEELNIYTVVFHILKKIASGML